MGEFNGFREAPWLPKAAINILDAIIEPGFRIVETGSGSSTFWFAQRAFYIHSFEHKSSWAVAVNNEAEVRGLKNIGVHLDTLYPGNGFLENEILKKSVDEIGLFDLALVDGRGRAKSLETLFKWIKPGGWIALDNADRERYRRGREFLDERTKASFDIRDKIYPEMKNGFTTFWRLRDENGF